VRTPHERILIPRSPRPSAYRSLRDGRRSMRTAHRRRYSRERPVSGPHTWVSRALRSGINAPTSRTSVVRRGVRRIQESVDSIKSVARSDKVSARAATMSARSTPMSDESVQVAAHRTWPADHFACGARASAHSTDRITGYGTRSAPPSATPGRMSAGAGDMPVARGTVGDSASQRAIGAS